MKPRPRHNQPVVRFFFSHCIAFVCLLQSSQTACCGADAFQKLVAPAFKQHCATCHSNDDDAEAEVQLAALTVDDLSHNIDLLDRLITVLDLEEMPPADQPPLNATLRQQLIRELKAMLEAEVSQQNTFPHTPIRRMNRFQYNNAVVDLFNLNCIVFTLPERMMREHGSYFQPDTGRMPDVVSVGSRPLGKSQMIEPRLAGVAAFPQDLRAEHGFDNRGDHLSLSPLLMEAFLKLGQSITTSPDFTSKRVGVWNTFFAPPADEIEHTSDTAASEIRKRVQWLLPRAFRRTVAAADVDRYTAFAVHQLHQGSDFVTAMKLVAAAVISSPRFLYLYNTAAPESDSPEETANRSGDHFELASRLSFFLWGSLPDEELRQLAETGQLKQPEILRSQVDRMLADRKLKRFCDSFPSQWLQLDRIISSVPNPRTFPKFYFSKYRDSMHMMLEPLLLFETVLIEDRPITQLIDSDFTYRSGLLEDAYGMLGSAEPVAKKNGEVAQLTFHRTPITDRRTGGVITNAAVMTMTSGPERTQPITRGAWMATVIFNNPPEPPPADVPPLGEKPAEGEEHLTLRERLSLHRERADCRGCHEQIDPLGFALENFDPVGNWRERYENGRDVDMSGELFRRHTFSDVVEFKDAILAEKDRFTKALAGHLLSFALARELGPADQSALDKITAAK